MPRPETKLERRTADLAARVAEHHDGPLELQHVAIVCAGCGKLEQATDVAALEALLDGWAISNGRAADLCPRCVTALNAMQARAEARAALGRLGSTLRRLTRREAPSA